MAGAEVVARRGPKNIGPNNFRPGRGSLGPIAWRCCGLADTGTFRLWARHSSRSEPMQMRLLAEMKVRRQPGNALLNVSFRVADYTLTDRRF